MDRRLAALILAAASALAGCGGGDSREEYTKDLRDLDRELSQLGDEVGETISAAPQTPDEELARRLGDLADRTGDLEDELDGLDAPDDVQPEQDRLEKAVARAKGALEQLEDAVRAGSRQGAGEATVRLVETSRELLEAQRAVQRELASEPR